MAEKYELAEQDYKAGMKYKDIAEKYGVSLNTVKSWKTRKWGKDDDEKSVHTKSESVHTKIVDSSDMESEETDEFGMTPKQRKFADCYIKLGNATEAAKLAGYSQKVARQQGAENLSKPYIKSYIDKQLEVMSSEDIADATEVMKYFTSVMRRQQQEYVPVTLSKEESKWVDGKKQTVKTEEVEIVEIPARLSDANKAAEFLGKHYRLTQYVDKETRDLSLERARLANDKLRAELNKLNGDASNTQESEIAKMLRKMAGDGE